MSHRLTDEERQRILLTCNQPDFAALPPGQQRSGGVAEREVAQIAADLVGRACRRERIGKGRRQPLILHAGNGNAMRVATLETRLEDLGVLRSFSRPRVSNDNPYSESLFRTVK